MLKDHIFQWNLTYLTDLFSALNELNLNLHGRNGTIINNYDYIHSKASTGIKNYLLKTVYCFLYQHSLPIVQSII
nr:unnamed protein product [Callosobruchus analis]